MEQNKFRTYTLYAIGEILLVVIGILIALQVNNWNEDKKERRVEEQLLQQIQQDLTGALQDINLNIGLLDQAIHSSEIVLKHLDGNEAYHDSIGLHISQIFTWTRLVIDMGGYESMKSEGISIISNEELRNRIINLFEGRLYFHREYEQLLGNRSEYLINKEGSAYFKSMNEGFGFWNGKFSQGISEPLNYDQLRKDPSFRYHVATMKSQTHGFQEMANLANRRRINELIREIEIELATF